MDRKTFLTLALCSLVWSTHAQSIRSISGNVVNAQQEPLFGNAMIVSPEDSSIIRGTSFLQGRFKLAALDDQHVLLKLASLEFQDTYLTVEYDGTNHVDLGDIVVADAQYELDEVVVVAKNSLVRERADGSIEVSVGQYHLSNQHFGHGDTEQISHDCHQCGRGNRGFWQRRSDHLYQRSARVYRPPDRAVADGHRDH